jgi:small-conductance mechanosensitive channel
LGKIGDSTSISQLTAPGTPVGQTQAGQAAFKYEQEQEAARKEEKRKEIIAQRLQEFTSKHGNEVSKDVINLLANIGALDDAIKQVIEVNAARQKEEEALREQKFTTSERIAGQEHETGERLAEQKFDVSERKAKFGQDVEMEKLKSDIKQKEAAAEEEELKTSPLFTQMSEKEKTYVFDANSTFQNLDNVYRIVKKLDEGKLKGFIRAVQGKKEVLKNPEVQELYSAYQMLTGAITKQIQGARPSDYDAVKYEMATGQRAISKENMKTALDMIANYVAAQTNSVKRSLSVGYGFDENRVNDLFGNTAQKYLKATGKPPGLTDEEWEEMKQLEKELGNERP